MLLSNYLSSTRIKFDDWSFTKENNGIIFQFLVI